jgi:hypothetical protein
LLAFCVLLTLEPKNLLAFPTFLLLALTLDFGALPFLLLTSASEGVLKFPAFLLLALALAFLVLALAS